MIYPIPTGVAAIAANNMIQIVFLAALKRNSQEKTLYIPYTKTTKVQTTREI